MNSRPPTRRVRVTAPASAQRRPRDGEAPRLLADIGGTYARFAMQRRGRKATKLRRYRCVEFPDIVSATRAYLRDARITTVPNHAAMAVAAPIVGDRVRMTNHPWTFSIAAVRRALGLQSLIVVNDFLAIAESVPHLRADERRRLGGEKPIAGGPIAVIGPGTGLGVGALVPDRDGGWHAIATEGGHASMAPDDALDEAVIREIRRHHVHVSAERCLSGGGLVNLYRALATLDKTPAKDLSPPAITAHAIRGDPLAKRAVALFCAMLGSTAGNLALLYGAIGGVYIAGGIVLKLGDLFDAAAFRRRFADKGRYRGYLRPIPVYVITHPLPALIGLAALLDRDAGDNPLIASARSPAEEERRRPRRAAQG